MIYRERVLYILNLIHSLGKIDDNWFEMKMRIHFIFWKIDTEYYYKYWSSFFGFKYIRRWIPWVRSYWFDWIIRKMWSDLYDTSEIERGHKLTKREFDHILAKRCMAVRCLTDGESDFLNS